MDWTKIKQNANDLASLGWTCYALIPIAPLILLAIIGLVSTHVHVERMGFTLGTRLNSRC